MNLQEVIEKYLMLRKQKHNLKLLIHGHDKYEMFISYTVIDEMSVEGFDYCKTGLVTKGVSNKSHEEKTIVEEGVIRGYSE